MLVLEDYTLLTLTLWVEQFYHYKLLWKLRQAMRVRALQPYIYDDDTIHGITWIIIGCGSQYFSQSLMPSAFIGNIMETQIALLESTLGLMENKLSMVIPIRVREIWENWRSQFTGYQTQENKQGGDKLYVQGCQSWVSSKRDTQNIPDRTQKRSGRDPKVYKGKLFIETSPKLKGLFKTYFASGYQKLYLTEILKEINKAIDSLPKCKNSHSMEGQNYASDLYLETSPMELNVDSSMYPGGTYQLITIHNW